VVREEVRNAKIERYCAVRGKPVYLFIVEVSIVRGALQEWGSFLKGIPWSGAGRERAVPDSQAETLEIPGSHQELLRAIAALEIETGSPEVRDNLVARWLGGEVAGTQRLMEVLAQQGYLHLKKDLEPGYIVYLSARGRARL
jgi:hypothetical protein